MHSLYGMKKCYSCWHSDPDSVGRICHSMDKMKEACHNYIYFFSIHRFSSLHIIALYSIKCSVPFDAKKQLIAVCFCMFCVVHKVFQWQSPLLSLSLTRTFSHTHTRTHMWINVSHNVFSYQFPWSSIKLSAAAADATTVTVTVCHFKCAYSFY